MNHDEPTTYSNIIQHNPIVSIGCMSSSYGSHRVLKSPTSASISIWRPTLPAQTHLTRISDKVAVISAYGIHRHCGIPFPILSDRPWLPLHSPCSCHHWPWPRSGLSSRPAHKAGASPPGLHQDIRIYKVVSMGFNGYNMV